MVGAITPATKPLNIIDLATPRRKRRRLNTPTWRHPYWPDIGKPRANSKRLNLGPTGTPNSRKLGAPSIPTSQYHIRAVPAPPFGHHHQHLSHQHCHHQHRGHRIHQTEHHHQDIGTSQERRRMAGQSGQRPTDGTGRSDGGCSC